MVITAVVIMIVVIVVSLHPAKGKKEVKLVA
jgi:hypothetical protein